MIQEAENYPGLTDPEVEKSRHLHGSNSMTAEERGVLAGVLRDVITEPMFLLLLAACIIYFLAGQIREGIIMLVSLFIVAGISLFQEFRSRNAVRALNKLSAAKATVMRNGIKMKIAVEQLVTGDLLLLEEGELIGADGSVLSANDFSVNESILTGEAFSVYKSASENSTVYKGTLISSGSAAVRVTAVGEKSELGKIGRSLQSVTVVKTPLQVQIRAFVRNMVWIGAIAFLLVVAFNYYRSGDLISAFLQGLTMAMSLLPEEIPVAFSTFQALGAFRLLQNQIIVKQPQQVETLGAATVICCDKTGTLTENNMRMAFMYDAATRLCHDARETKALPPDIVAFAMWASETQPFDPMEQAIHELYAATAPKDERKDYRQVHEYPIGGRPPMMTHIFSNPEGQYLIAAKGAAEAILNQSELAATDKERILAEAIRLASEGYRVLGVGRGLHKGTEWPAQQQQFRFEFLGLLAFYDPPKAHIRETLQTFSRAGIEVKMITGDYAQTAAAIAAQVGLDGNGKIITGPEIMELTPAELQQKVGGIALYARMFPEAKLKVIEALRSNGEVVAMTGDGVNDGPALKAAHIGIAMGKRGSEVAKAAASLILTDDNLSHMAEAVALGRKIYDNLKKAIRYIVSIHIPIILIVTIPLLLGWSFSAIFSPVHVIFLELIMGPTCSIIYENEPMEPGTMNRPPRRIGQTFLSFRQLMLSMVQGLIITAGCLGIGYHYLHQQATPEVVRTVIFITLLFSNVWLTLVNRSFVYSILQTLRYRNPLVPLIIGITLSLIAASLFVPFVRALFLLSPLTIKMIGTCLLVAMASTLWMEVWKMVQRKQTR